MASIKEIVKNNYDDIVKGTMWVVIYKKDINWYCRSFCYYGGDYENGFIFQADDIARMKEISKTDHKAIVVNGSYMGYGRDLTYKELKNKIIQAYISSWYQLSGYFIDCCVKEVKTE